MQSETEIKKKVMRRVYGIYTLRTLAKPEVRLLTLGVVTLVLTFSVSVKNVFSNALAAFSTPGGFLQYVLNALVSTEVSIKILAILFIVLIVFAVRDFCVLCITMGVATLGKQEQRQRG